MKPKIQREMYKSANTFEVLLSRLDNKIDPKKIALMLVGVPKMTLCSGACCYVFLASCFWDPVPAAWAPIDAPPIAPVS
jgi:hypothetical protein